MKLQYNTHNQTEQWLSRDIHRFDVNIDIYDYDYAWTCDLHFQKSISYTLKVNGDLIPITF